MDKQKTTHLKFFGIGKILPFLKGVRNKIFIMVFFGLMGSLTDIILPLRLHILLTVSPTEQNVWLLPKMA